MKKPPSYEFEDRDRHPENKNWRMVFTDRDRRILEHIWEYDGFLTDRQVEALEFTGIRQAQHRLGKLFHNGFLRRTNRRGRTAHGAMIYWLARQGAEYVAEAKGIEWEDFRHAKALKQSMEHDILVNDFTIILQKACEAAAEFCLFEWTNESVFRADPDRVTYTTITGKQATRNIIPDRYFVIDRQGQDGFRSRLLLELDCATHPNKRFADFKVRAGLAYLRSDAYQARFAGVEDKLVGGRWLVVTTSDDRLEYLRDTTERAAGNDARVFYFTTFERVTVESVLTEPIWVQGGIKEPVALFPAR